MGFWPGFSFEAYDGAGDSRFTFAVSWVWRGRYDPPIAWRPWLYTAEHDSDSLWWNIAGFGICIRIKGKHYE